MSTPTPAKPTRTVMIRNLRSRPLTLNLPATIVPEASLKLRAGTRPGKLPTVRGRPGRGALNAEAPKKALAPVERRVSGSISLEPHGKGGSVKRWLPASVTKAPDVIAAKARGDISVEIVKVAKVNGEIATPTEHPRQAARQHSGRSATRRKLERSATRETAVAERQKAAAERAAKRSAEAPKTEESAPQPIHGAKPAVDGAKHVAPKASKGG